MDAPNETPIASTDESPESTGIVQRFSRAFLLLAPTFLSFALIDVVGTSRVGPDGVWARICLGLGLFGYVLPIFLVLAVVMAGVVSVLGSLTHWAQRHGLPRFSGEKSTSDALAATLPVVSLFVLVVSSMHLAALRFNNHQLAALLVALVTVGTLAVLGLGWMLGFAGARRLRSRLAQRPRTATFISWAVAAIPLLAVAGWQGWLNRDGFRILGPWMFAGPIVALAAFLGLRTRRFGATPLPRPVRLAAWSVLPATTLISAALGFVWQELPTLAVQGGLWSSVVVRGARIATDVDRDGSSSLFGDGDCAPFDRRIHPRAQDIPGDGIDSNCLNGDAAPFKPEQPPRWYDDAPGLGRSKNLVVVTIEALRSDHVSFLGYKHRTTPNIDALALKSVVFPKMYAASSATTLSLASMFTTSVPSYTKTRPGKGHVGIDGSMPWIPEILRAEGFRTGAVLVDYMAFLRDGWNMGYDRGFEHYDTTTKIEMKGGMFYGFPSGGVIDKVNAFVDESAGKRFMVWTHLVEPHAAYQREKGAPDFGDDDQGLYASDIWAADRQVGRLIDHLADRGLLDNTVILITGDHAEAFGEHGLKYHYSSVFDTQLRTLGLLYVPGLGHRKVEQAVIHQDLTTTAMNLLGVKREFERLRGRNLVPTFGGFRVEPDEVFPELAGFQVRVRTFALVQWPFKLIHPKGTKSYQLFHLEKDPGEKRDVAKEYPAQLETMRERMVQHVEAIGARR